MSAGLRIGSTKRYQHVSIGNANCSHWGPDPTQSPNGSGFAYIPLLRKKVALGPGVGSLRWACTFFMLISFALGSRRKRSFQWNMGFRIFFPNTLPRSYVIVFKVNIEVFNIAKKDVLILQSYCNAGVDPVLTDLLFF